MFPLNYKAYLNIKLYCYNVRLIGVMFVFAASNFDLFELT